MKNQMTEFDDDKLKQMTHDCPGVSYARCPDVVNILDKTELTNKDRNILLEYIRLNPKHIKPASIKSMKNEIFDLIGYTTSNCTGTISRDEITAIHAYIFANRSNKK